MNIGRMREKVAIQIPSTSMSTDGDMGQPTWSKVAHDYAEIVPLSGGERLRAATLAASVQYRVRLRYRADLSVDARLVCLGPDFDGSTMQIHAIVKDHRRGSMELDCSEVVA